jgi:hypothetical protein
MILFAPIEDTRKCQFTHFFHQKDTSGHKNDDYPVVDVQGHGVEQPLEWRRMDYHHIEASQNNLVQKIELPSFT